jgi:hypothetical protein
MFNLQDFLDHVHVVFVDGVPNTPNNPVYHYQTLIAAALALLAAGLTVHYIRKQIEQSDKQHKENLKASHAQIEAANKLHRENIERNARSVRSNLPLALSEISDYSGQCVDLLSKIFPGFEEDENIELQIEVPELPITALSIVTELISLTEEKNAEKLQSLLRFIQIQHSRLKSLQGNISPNRPNSDLIIKSNLHSNVLDAFALKRMTDHFFYYARWEEDVISEVGEQIHLGPLEFTLHTRFDSPTI